MKNHAVQGHQIVFIYCLAIYKFDVEICIDILQLLLVLILVDECFENREPNLKHLYADIDCIFSVFLVFPFIGSTLQNRACCQQGFTKDLHRFPSSFGRTSKTAGTKVSDYNL